MYVPAFLSSDEMREEDVSIKERTFIKFDSIYFDLFFPESYIYDLEGIVGSRESYETDTVSTSEISAIYDNYAINLPYELLFFEDGREVLMHLSTRFSWATAYYHQVSLIPVDYSGRYYEDRKIPFSTTTSSMCG